MDSEFWDERFNLDEYIYGVEPNDFLRDEAARIPPGRVLSLGEGEGRNAVFLAGRGHEVTAVDFSPAGLRKIQRLAAARNVTVDVVEADLSTYEPPADTFSGVISIFVHLPAETRRQLYTRAARALRSGGCLILELYRPEQVALGTGGPKDALLLPSLAELRETLADLDLVVAREANREIHEGRFHGGPSATVQVVGVRRR